MKTKSFLVLCGLLLLVPNNSFAQLKSVQMELNGVPGAKVNGMEGGINVFLEDTSIDLLRIKTLGRFRGIHYLSLKGQKVTDSILQEVAKFPNLKYISIFEGDVSDEGLKHLSNCKTLV